MFGKKSDAKEDYLSPFRPLSDDEQAKFDEFYPLADEADRVASESFELPGAYEITQRASDGLWYVAELSKPSSGMYELARVQGKRDPFRSTILIDPEESKNYDRRNFIEAWEKGRRPKYHIDYRPMGKKVGEYEREGFTSRKLAEKYLHDYLNPIKEKRIYDEKGSLVVVEPIETVKADLAS